MYKDNYGLIVFEQCSFPGSIGDSCAETFTELILKRYLVDYEKTPDFSKLFVLNTYSTLRTDKGYLRHPEAPEKDEKGNSWRESDFSGDQWLPMYIAISLGGFMDQMREMEERLKANFYRYGNGDLAHPSVFATKRRAHGMQNSFYDAQLLIQAWSLQNLNYRWNDEKKWIEKSESSSCDWKNFFLQILFADIVGHTRSSLKAKSLVKPGFLLSRIFGYYAPEPNSTDMLKLYERAAFYSWRQDSGPV